MTDDEVKAGQETAPPVKLTPGVRTATQRKYFCAELSEKGCLQPCETLEECQALHDQAVERRARTRAPSGATSSSGTARGSNATRASAPPAVKPTQQEHAADVAALSGKAVVRQQEPGQAPQMGFGL